MKALTITFALTLILGIILMILSNTLDWSNGLAAFIFGCMALMISAATGIAALVVRARNKK